MAMRARALHALLALLLPHLATPVAPATGNFGISTPSCFLAEGPLINPPVYSTYLAEVGRGSTLSLSLDGGAPVPLASAFAAHPAPVFPQCAFQAPLAGGLTLSWSLLAPLSPALPEHNFLPVLLGALRLQLEPSAPPFSRNATVTFALVCGTDEASRRACGQEVEAGQQQARGGGSSYAYLAGGGVMNATQGGLFVAARGGLAVGADCGPSSPGVLCASLTLEVRPSARQAAGTLCLGYHAGAQGRYAQAHPTPAHLAAHALQHAPTYAAHHAA